jgi:hypothetical protein
LLYLQAAVGKEEEDFPALGNKGAGKTAEKEKPKKVTQAERAGVRRGFFDKILAGEAPKAAPPPQPALRRSYAPLQPPPGLRLKPAVAACGR